MIKRCFLVTKSRRYEHTLRPSVEATTAMVTGGRGVAGFWSHEAWRRRHCLRVFVFWISKRDKLQQNSDKNAICKESTFIMFSMIGTHFLLVGLCRSIKWEGNWIQKEVFFNMHEALKLVTCTKYTTALSSDDNLLKPIQCVVAQIKELWL